MVSIFFHYFGYFLFSSLVVQVNSQLCHGVPQYGRCSSNTACGCLHMEGALDIGICGFQWVMCSELTPCDEIDNYCQEPDRVCVRHPRCHERPVCFPVSMMDSKVCPPTKTATSTSTFAMSTTTTTQKTEFIPLRASGKYINPDARWEQNAVTVAESYQRPDGTNSSTGVYFPMGLFVDDERTVYVTDPNNHRVLEWKLGASTGVVAAGGNERGNGAHQLNGPSDVFVDKETDSLVICDNTNKRVVRWPRVNGKSGETIISNVTCHGITMDEAGTIYAVGFDLDLVKRYRKGDSEGTIVAGGNGRGSRLDQLNWPQYIFVDRDHSIYVSEWYNGRVTKWVEGAKEGIVVAGGHGQGNALSQLYGPEGVVVDEFGTVYVADSVNDRVMRWPKGATQGTVIAGGNGQGKQSNQLSHPFGLAFDQDNNLYVVDHWNSRNLGFKTNYEQDPIFAHRVNQIAALAFLQPNDVSQVFDDLYNSLPQILHPLLDYFEDTYVGRNRTQGRAKIMFEIEFWNMHQRTTDHLMRTNNSAEA
ncbi:unnamed protein product [Rotaria magnacalcarata]|uniref:Uncharacterized protein n=1 Tax=Rotaria magnacalcarata TaxID=392030 RepID=A0A816BWZ6_9BILA|nr:unnamed protein product [Rotaria magnacalcarata]CAF1614519.1 unnamed protein product [Rotaria magnacalcarata]CAF2097189.1 unnamed protein product [Rotaria magnacalcarata]